MEESAFYNVGSLENEHFIGAEPQEVLEQFMREGIIISQGNMSQLVDDIDSISPFEPMRSNHSAFINSSSCGNSNDLVSLIPISPPPIAPLEEPLESKSPNSIPKASPPKRNELEALIKSFVIEKGLDLGRLPEMNLILNNTTESLNSMCSLSGNGNSPSMKSKKRKRGPKVMESEPNGTSLIPKPKTNPNPNPNPNPNLKTVIPSSTQIECQTPINIIPSSTSNSELNSGTPSLLQPILSSPLLTNSTESSLSPHRSDALSEILLGEKNIHHFCAKVLNYICGFLSAEIGGFYLNESNNVKDWYLCNVFPSMEKFSTHFHFNMGFHIVLQSIMEKRCLSVSNSGGMVFLFAPIFSVQNQPLGVIVLGSSRSDSIANDMNYLEQARGIISSVLARSGIDLSNPTVMKKFESLMLENEQLKQRDIFNKSLLVGILSAMNDVSIICTTTKGVITYFSPGAQQLLGYSPNEMVGRYTPVKIHVPTEIQEREKQLEIELGRKVTGFDVFVEYAKMGVSETRQWCYVRKDGIPIHMELTVKSLLNNINQQIIGFLGIGKLVLQ